MVTGELLIEMSDVGLRRSDREAVEGMEQFAIVVDTGVGGGFLCSQTDWRTPDELRDYAARIVAAADWLQGQ